MSDHDEKSQDGGSEDAPPPELFVKIGIEIEGVGGLVITWNQQPKKALIENQKFLASVKAAKLNRSASFNEKDLRGIYLSAEESDSVTNRPAELVSVPHKYDPESLVNIHNSVWKKLGGGVTEDESPMFEFDSGGKTAPTMTSSTYQPRKDFYQIGGSLQTTIGVSIAKLFAKDDAKRMKTIAFLAGKPNKQEYVFYLTSMARLAAIWSIEGTVPLVQVDRLALVFFMAFIDPAVKDLPKGTKWGSWEKHRLGANFKAQSSFISCGIDQTLTAHMQQKFANAGYKKQLIDFLRGEVTRNTATITILEALQKNLDTKMIGAAGRCMQVLYENGMALPNFLVGEQLHIVVEAREKDAGLNQAMLPVLNFTTKSSGAPELLMPSTGPYTKCLGLATKTCLLISEMLH